MLKKAMSKLKIYFCTFSPPNFEAEVWSVFCSRYLVEVTKLNVGQDSEARFGR